MKFAGFVLLGGCLLAASAAGAEPVRTVTLDNGLTVVLAPDAASPVVDVAVWYRAGSRDEKAGTTGISHLFEHLMFRGSAGVQGGEHQRTLQQAGATVNAFTTADYTCFHQTMAPALVGEAMRLEADRMRALALTPASLEAERAAVRAERRGRNENSPLGRGLQRLYELAYPGHPYRWPVIGLEADLDRITLEECRRWHRARYAPSNAVLTVVGGVDADTALAFARRWFGAVPRRPSPAAPVPAPAAPAGAKRAEEPLDLQVPLLAAGWRAFGDADPDDLALDAVSRVLAQGQESRLQKALVRDARTAVFVQSGVDGRRDGQLFYVLAAATPGADAAGLEQALVAEVERLAAEDVTEAELTRARNQLEASLRSAMLTARGRASALAVAQLDAGSAAAADERLARAQSLTAADLRRAAGRVLRESGRHVVWVRPAAAAGTGGAR